MTTVITFTKSQIRRYLIAASTDPVRASIHCLRIESDRVVATDGYRLHVHPIETLDLSGPISVRRDVLEVAAQINPRVQIERSPSAITLHAGRVTIRDDRPPIPYPPYHAVLPDPAKLSGTWEITGREARAWLRDAPQDDDGAVTIQDGPRANPRYLADAIRAAKVGIKDPIRLAWSGATDPIEITTSTEPGFRAIVMPMRR